MPQLGDVRDRSLKYSIHNPSYSLFARSKKPLDTVISKPEFDCLRVSAGSFSELVPPLVISSHMDTNIGHDTHEYTSGYAINSVFEFLEKRALVFPTEDPNDGNYDGADAPSKNPENKVEEVKAEKKMPKATDGSTPIPTPLLVGGAVAALAVVAFVFYSRKPAN